MSDEAEKHYTIELWNHGTAGDHETPCGEVDIFSISGELIPFEILRELCSEDSGSPKNDWFGELPTERALSVHVLDVSGSDGFNLRVVDYSVINPT